MIPAWFGTIVFQAEGVDMGRFLSQCREQGICIRRFQAQNDICCVGLLAPGEYERVRSLGEQSGVYVQILEKRGGLFWIRRYRKRLGLLIGGGIAAALLLFLQCFVWTITISGNQEITTAHIMAAAEKSGLKRGLFLPGADLEQIKLKMLGELPTLSFLSLNRLGSRVEIELSEETPKPFVVPGNEPCNIVAGKTAQIVETEVYRGQKMVQIGDVVYAGDLLVSGIVETADQKTIYHHADAKVLARTHFTKEFSISLQQEEKVYIGKEQKRYRLELFGKKLPLFPALSMKSPCDVQRVSKPLRLCGITFPINVETETRSFYEVRSRRLTEAEARAWIEKNRQRYEEEELTSAVILSREFEELFSDGVLYQQIHYQCLENIAVSQKLDVEIDPDFPTRP